MDEAPQASVWSRSRRLTRHPYTILTVLFCIALIAPFCTRKHSDFATVYLPAAGRLAQGQDIYQGAFVYPPVNAWMAIPFASLPNVPARLMWLAVNVVALVVLVRGAWRLAGGGRLEGNPFPPRREHVIFGLGLLCGGAYILDSLTAQQTDLLVAALVITGCQALVRRYTTRAGVWLGVATGIKCTPLLWTPYLLWRKRWAAAVVVPVIALGLNLLPELTHPSSGPHSRVEEWGRRFLSPMSSERNDVGVWNTAVNFNHSIPGALHRWFLWDRSWVQGEDSITPKSNRISPETLRLVVGATLLAFVLLALVSSWKSGRGQDLGSAGGETPGPSREALEFSLVLILMVLLSPQSSKPHFCTLVLPGFCLARAALTRPDRLLLALVLGAGACGLAANKDLVGKMLYSWFKWYGSITLGAMLLYLGCCLALIRPGRAVRPDNGPTPPAVQNA